MPAKPGGIAHHKPDCPCTACQRKAKALALAARVAAESPQPSEGTLDADIFEVEGNSARTRVAQWIKYRALEPGITNIEVAKRIGIATSTMNAHLAKARKEGWLTFSDPLARIEHEIIPQALDNAAFYLSKEGGRDKQITLETLKATAFRQFIDSKGISEAPQTVLALKIETIPTDSPVKVLSGHVVGAARVIEAEVVDDVVSK